MQPMAILLGLGAALTYGAADFFGGLSTKRSNEFSVVVCSQVIGSGLLLAALPFFLQADFTAEAFAWGLGSGVGGGLGVLLLYRGLALGRMSVVAPTTGVVAASVPVVAGLLLGERPSAAALTGVVVALVAVVLVSSSPDHTGARGGYSGMREAVGAGAAFGAFFILLSLAGDDSGLWPLIGARSASLGIVALIALMGRRTLRPAPGSLRLIAAAGILDVAANLLFLAASRVGLLSLVAVLTSMYPGATVVLARFVLHERLHRLQLVGLACAALGVALIAVG
jgi:drug/metabolite transporter (DMT)-like permease